MKPNERTCPSCSQIIEHANEAAAQGAAKKNKPCRTCMYATRKNPTAASCPYCEFTTKKLTAFDEHMKSSHSMTTKDAWDKINNGPIKCKCGCGAETTWISWHNGYSGTLKGHSSNIYAVYAPEKAAQISESRKNKLRGKTSWAKGLTKETDDRVASRAASTSAGRKAAFEEGKITIWSKGLTKETDDRLKVASDNLSRMFQEGQLVPWAKGLNKASSEKIAAMAAKVAITHSNKNLREKLDASKRLMYEEIKERVESHGTLALNMPDASCYINDNVPNISVKCTRCSKEWNSSLRRLQSGRCWSCDSTGSVAQSEIYQYVKSKNVAVDSCRRDVLQGLEIDIYVPEHRFGIEYNGLYWHSVINKSSIYHNNKSIKAQENHVNLLHIFEDEWKNKRDIVCSMIDHKLKLHSKKYDARKCTVRSVSTQERKAFFNGNHIDGDVASNAAYGLFANDELLACMSVRKPFHSAHKDAIEIARACCKSNVNVRGWLGRLTKHCATQSKLMGASKMISYIDTRLGTSGKSWERAGWKFNSSTPPRFWWTDFDTRFNRFKFKANKPMGLTEAQVAEEAGVVKIYGCGNMLYEMELLPSPRPTD